MRRRVRRSVTPDPVKLVLRALEEREAPSESLSFLSGQMFYGVAARAGQPAARVAPPATAATAATAAMTGATTAAHSAPIRLTPPPTDAARSAATVVSGSDRAATVTAWADPWAGWVDGAFPNDGLGPAPVTPPADDAGAAKGGGGNAAPGGPPGPSNEAAAGGAAGTAALARQDAGVDPAAAAAPAPAHAAKAAKGAAGTTGSGSPFPWAQPPVTTGGLTPLSVTYGAGTTVFTPATLTHPSYVVDANKGAVLSEAVVNNDFSKFAVDLRAQVSGVTIKEYDWDTSGATDATSVSGANTERLQFTWGTFTGDARTEAITLTEDFVGGGSQSQTFHFLVTADDSPAFSGEPTAVSTSTIVPPDQLQAGAAAVTGPHHSISLADGSLSTAISLPAYNPTVPALALEYNSMAADPRPIFLTRFELGIDAAGNGPSPADGRRHALDQLHLRHVRGQLRRLHPDRPAGRRHRALDRPAQLLDHGQAEQQFGGHHVRVVRRGQRRGQPVRGRVVAGRAGPDRLRHRRGGPGHGRRHQPVVHRRRGRDLHQPGRRLLDA